MRPPRFAGTFYPASENGLRQALHEAFTGERGPGSEPPKRESRAAVAAIVPHAGYPYSGPCAAWAYHALAASPKPDLYLLLGPNHHALASGTTMEPWETPLGIVRADQTFIRALVQKGSVPLADEIFAREHSLEVQLPFLQYISPQPEKLKIVPLLVSADLDLDRVALDIKETLVETGKTAVIIASSDFTHHGPDYRYVRFTQEPQQQIAAFDKQMLNLIKEGRADDFLNFVEREQATVCGARAITLLLKLLKPGTNAKLEQYYTSAEVTGDRKNSVSYAAMVFE